MCNEINNFTLDVIFLIDNIMKTLISIIYHGIVMIVVVWKMLELQLHGHYSVIWGYTFELGLQKKKYIRLEARRDIHKIYKLNRLNSQGKNFESRLTKKLLI